MQFHLSILLGLISLTWVNIDVNTVFDDLIELLIDILFVCLQLQNPLDLMRRQINGLLHLRTVRIQRLKKLLVKILLLNN